ncbi:MAG: DUF3786 domain-containing protein [Chloroflexi bacterium]|nr:DUF3786 domain-containing protein [Chloroflexota bacterium]
MLQRGKSTPQLQEWFDKLAPVVEEARATLWTVKPGKLALRTGSERDEDGNFCLNFFWQAYVVSADDLSVRPAGADKESPSFIQSLILTYLATADGTTPSSRWIGFRELPNGMFYVQAFQGYTGGRLVREMPGGIDSFRRVAEALGGKPLEYGDAGYAFTVLPRIHLALTYWEGDEEDGFPAQARVLFEDTTSHYMCTDGLAILGSQLVGKMLKAAR